MGRCRPRLNCTVLRDPFAEASSHANCTDSHRRLGGGPGDWSPSDINSTSASYRSRSVHDPWDVDCEPTRSRHTLCGRGPVMQCRNLDVFSQRSYRSDCDNSCPCPSLERSVYRSNVCKIEKASFPMKCNTPSREIDTCCRSCGGPLETKTCGVSMTLDLSICPRCMPQACASGTPVSCPCPSLEKPEPMKNAPAARTIANETRTIESRTSSTLTPRLLTASVGTQGNPIISMQDAQTSYSNLSSRASNNLQNFTSRLSQNDQQTDYLPINYSPPADESAAFESRSTLEFQNSLSPTRLSSASPTRLPSIARPPSRTVVQDPVAAYQIPRLARPSVPIRHFPGVNTFGTPLPAPSYSSTAMKKPSRSILSVTQMYQDEAPKDRLERNSISRRLSETFYENPVARKSIASRPVSETYEENPLARKSTRSLSQSRKSLSRPVSPPRKSLASSRQSISRKSSVLPEGRPLPVRQKSIAISLKRNSDTVEEPPIFTSNSNLPLHNHDLATASNKRPSRLSFNPVRDNEHGRLSSLIQHDPSTSGTSPKALVLGRLSQVLGIKPDGRSSEETVHHSVEESHSLPLSEVEEPEEPSIYAKEMAEIKKDLVQEGIVPKSKSFAADYDGNHRDSYISGRPSSGQDEDSVEHERRKRRKERKRHYALIQADEWRRKEKEDYYFRRNFPLSRDVSPNRTRKETRFRSNSVSRDGQGMESSRRRGGAGMEMDDFYQTRSNTQSWNAPNTTEVYDQYLEESSGSGKSFSETSLHEGEPLQPTSREYVDPDRPYSFAMAEEYGADAAMSPYYEPPIGNYYDSSQENPERQMSLMSDRNSMPVYPESDGDDVSFMGSYGEYAPPDQYSLMSDEFAGFQDEYYDQTSGDNSLSDEYDEQFGADGFRRSSRDYWYDEDYYGEDCGCNDCPLEFKATIGNPFWDYLSAVWIPKQEYALALIAIAILMMLFCLTSQLWPFMRSFLKPSKCIRWFG